MQLVPPAKSADARGHWGAAPQLRNLGPRAGRQAAALGRRTGRAAIGNVAARRWPTANWRAELGAQLARRAGSNYGPA